MVQFKSIILITVIGLIIFFSGCIKEEVSTKQVSTQVLTPTPIPTVIATPRVTANPFLEAIPTGNQTLVRLDSRRGFVPDTVTINAGDEILWSNYDTETVTLISGDGLFVAQVLQYYAGYRYVFKMPGTYNFYLKENKNLADTIIVSQAIPQTATSTATPRELPSGTLYVDARMIIPSYWSYENYSLHALKVQIYNQFNIPISIRAQIVSDGQVLEETSFILENAGSSYQFTNEKSHFMKSADVILRLFIQDYQPVDYKFRQVSSLD
jgi:plastocyanin